MSLVRAAVVAVTLATLVLLLTPSSPPHPDNDIQTDTVRVLVILTAAWGTCGGPLVTIPRCWRRSGASGVGGTVGWGEESRGGRFYPGTWSRWQPGREKGRKGGREEGTVSNDPVWISSYRPNSSAEPWRPLNTEFSACHGTSRLVWR